MKMNDVHVRWILKLESAVALGFAVWFYLLQGGDWGRFLMLFLLPDVAMVGYLAGPRVGAMAYNAAHNYAVPAVLAVVMPSPLWMIWLAHIGFDRLLGYGLKLPEGFGHTHLGAVGRARQIQSQNDSLGLADAAASCFRGGR